jgi:hypothetical protein
MGERMSKEAMKLALEALTKNSDRVTEIRMKADAIKALEEALASEQEGQSNFCPQCEALSCELAAIKQGEPVAPNHSNNSQNSFETRMDISVCTGAQKQEQGIPKIGCVNHDCDKCKEQSEPVWALEDCVRTLKTLNYIEGIAVKGEGRQILDDESLEQFILGYVKRLEAELAKQEHGEPVAWLEGETIYWKEDQGLNDWIRKNGEPLYTTPQQRTWVGLTDEETNVLWVESESNINFENFSVVAYEIEAKLRSKTHDQRLPS